MRLPQTNRYAAMAIGLICIAFIGGLIVLSLVLRPNEPETINELIAAMQREGRLALSDHSYVMIKADVDSCDDVALIESCILAIENRKAEGADADSRNRVANMHYGVCVKRLEDIGTTEAAGVLVRMLDRTDAGGTLSVTCAITEIGRPALVALREHKGLPSKSALRAELCAAIEQGEVWEP